MSILKNGYEVEIYDLKTDKTEFPISVFMESKEGLENARKERIFWARKCSTNWGVRIRRLSDNKII